MAGFKQGNTGKTGLSDTAQTNFVNDPSLSGIAGDGMTEAIPDYIQTSTEEIVKNDSGANIVLGRDRCGSRVSGYGGRGDTQCASIDIVVGRMGPEAVKYAEGNQKIWVNPDFKKDAARIYISQKTDVDANFNLASGRIGSATAVGEDEFSIVDNVNRQAPSDWNPIPRSAIALKADGIRLIAREGIKLVTRTDAKNSQGGSIQSVQGVDIIAGNNDEDLQPMVKGDSLAMALDRIIEHMYGLAGIVDTLLTHQSTMNAALTNHFHFYGDHQMTTRSPPVQNAGMKTQINHLSQTKRSLANHLINIKLFTQTYLSVGGEKYINSRYNNTN
jgi:hypothetical protein